MVVRVDDTTLFAQIAPLLPYMEAEKVQEIKERAPFRVIGVDGYLSLTIGQFAAVISGNLAAITEHADSATLMTAFEYFTLDGLREFLEGYIKKLEALQPEMSSAERAAQKACLKVETAEGLMYFARDYFGLPSFAAAAEVTLAELLMAKKDTYNKIMYQKAFSAEMERAARRKKR